MVNTLHYMTTPRRPEPPGGTIAPTPADALNGLLMVTSLLEADQRRFHVEHGMTAARVHLLWQVGLTGPTSQRTIADALGVTPRAVTGLVDGLVESGHVTREPHPVDRRATLVTLTQAGADFVADLQESHAGLAADLFGDVQDERLAAFVDLLGETAERIHRLMKEAR